MIPYGRQNISKADIDAVVEVLRSDFLTQGPVVPRFEQTIADYCGVQHAIAVNSATSALHIACMALDVGPGDWVWTSPNTFVASANCALYCGAKVDFVDIDPLTYNMSVERLKEKLMRAKALERLPKLVIPVHFAGQPCDMVAIHALSNDYGFKIIEDASHAIGSNYVSTASGDDGLSKIVNVGSCVHSHITVFSFHPVKIITTGEGGIATTKDKLLANKMRRLRTHGITNDMSLMYLRPENEIWNYQQIELGFNYRMNDMQAALGISQFMRLKELISYRHQIADLYNKELGKLPLLLPAQRPGTYSSFHLYPIRVRKSLCNKSQREVYDELLKNEVAANLHYIPVHRHPYFEAMNFNKGDFPESELFHREVISLPIFASLGETQQRKVINILNNLFL